MPDLVDAIVDITETGSSLRANKLRIIDTLLSTNTKFIANDPKYKRIRHPSARYMVEQVKDVRTRFPHLSQVSFHDDSFMAIPYPQLEEFAERRLRQLHWMRGSADVGLGIE